MKLKIAAILPLLLIITACAAIGLQSPKTFDERWSYAQGQTTGLRDASTRALDAKIIDSADMEYCIIVADRSSQMLALARTAYDGGDVSTAEGRLMLVSGILNELEKYLGERRPK